MRNSTGDWGLGFMMKKHNWFMFLVLLTMTSCSPPPIDILVTKSADKLRVRLRETVGFFVHSERAPCVEEVNLWKSNLDWTVPAWRMRVVGKNCIPLGDFVLGDIPPGFQQTSLLTTVVGGKYRLHVSGSGQGFVDITLAGTH